MESNIVSSSSFDSFNFHTASTPACVELESHMTLASMLRNRFEDDPHGLLFKRKTMLGDRWLGVTVAEFYDSVMDIARGFVALGIKKGDVVATMSRTRYELSLLDFALWSIGALHVLIYETSSVSQAHHIIENSGCKLVIAENTSLRALLHQAVVGTQASENIYVLDNMAIEIITVKGLKVNLQEVLSIADSLSSNDLATIIYTSGTTGTPKGVELTHGNFYSVVANGLETPSLRELVWDSSKSTLLFLPMAHVFARFVSILPVYCRSILGHIPGAGSLVADLQSFQPTFLLVVPRVLEKVYNSADQKMGMGFKQKVFRTAALVAERYAQQIINQGKVSPLLKAQWLGFQKMVYSRITALLGGRLELLISGGAPMGDRLGYFYSGLGIHVLEGYGITETSAPIAVNLPGSLKMGTVGRPYSGAQIRISEDGEIQVKGPQVFSSYHNLPEATSEAFNDGWYRTGDVGELDNEGFLKITGRKKELIVTAGGKNVAPAPLEDRLRGHPLISQVVVVGDKRPFISALITLDADMLPGWLANHGIPQMSVIEAAQNPQVLAALDRAVKRTNAAVSRAESIRKFKVLNVDFTVSNGFLTPSLKVRREQVLDTYADDIEEMYTRR